MKSNKQHGDAVRIAKIVNELRDKKGKEELSLAYIRSMLNGTRTLTREVAIIVEKYYEAQEVINDITT